MEISTAELIKAVGNVNIKDDVRDELEVYGQNPDLKTWADVHDLINYVGNDLEPGVLERVKQSFAT